VFWEELRLGVPIEEVLIEEVFGLNSFAFVFKPKREALNGKKEDIVIYNFFHLKFIFL
jgi:hypothetical protein